MTVPVEAHITLQAGDHVVCFYENEAELGATVSAYMAAMARDDEIAVIVATEAHQVGFRAALSAAGLDVAGALGRGRLITVDAGAALARISEGGRIDPAAFDAAIGRLIRAAAQTGRPIRVYGEMVAQLWEAGDVVGAIELETLWNALAAEVAFSLLCAYPRQSVSAPGHADDFLALCHLHSAVVPTPAEDSRHFAAHLESPRAARHFVTASLRRWGYHDLIDAAAVVVTELATNAVVHAASPFVVTLAWRSNAVRIEVSDSSSAPPVTRHLGLLSQSGRGVGLVEALAQHWDAELSPAGKVVWAELRRPQRRNSW